MITMLFGISAELQASVVLGNTRVIYPSEAKEVTLSLKNTDTEQTFLVQSIIESAEGEKQHNFVATPPLLILKPGGANKLRVFLKSATPMPADRETLFWMSVKAVPSSKRKEEGNFVQFSVTNRIKLLYRPREIGTPDEQTFKKITFSVIGNDLVMNNPTPFYMNIESVKSGSISKESLTLGPRESQVVGKSDSASNMADVVFINDFGGDSDKVSVPVTR